ncbi:MAG: Rnase Y domain-containing protein, partial [Clostridium perfringens]|nr:Rnase Y domain-containing protein [Clostridium perfringens]
MVVGILIGIIILGVVGFIQYTLIQKASKNRVESLEKEASLTLEEAKREAESTKKEAILEAKEEVHKLRADLDKETRDRRNEIQRFERRLIQREESLDKKGEMLEKREDSINKKSIEIQELEERVQNLYGEQRAELERISNLSSEDARTLLLDEVRREIKHESAMLIKELETKAKEEADKKSREIITTAIQRCAADHVSETTVHVVALPNDEMKGRIIGREGRNIRTLETLTGVDLIIDDTP